MDRGVEALQKVEGANKALKSGGGGGKQLDISICPVNLSIQKHCCIQEVVISGKKCGGSCPPFSYPSDGHVGVPHLSLMFAIIDFHS